MRRRDLLTVLAGNCLLGPFLGSVPGMAAERTPYGGVLRLHCPLGLSDIDPHDLFSLDAAVLTSALFEPLYALDDRGRPYPTLAEQLPQSTSGGLKIQLRPQLRTARGRPLQSNDLEFSLRRAAGAGARQLLQPFGTPRSTRDKAPAVLFPGGDATALATALASPLTALVPIGFNPKQPDGPGPFTLTTRTPRLVLERNGNAARGGAFLDRIEVQRSADLAGALRAFEADEVDVGWLASGLHRARRQTTHFDAGPLGWVVLCTGKQLGPWAAPGVAQSVLDSAQLTALSALGLSVPSQHKSRPDTWRGPPSDVMVNAESPQLVAIARSLVEALGGANSKLNVSPTPAATVAAKRATGDYALLVEFVRKLGPSPADDLRALSTAALLSRAAGSAPVGEQSLPAPNVPLREITVRWRLGLVGRLHLRGAHLGRFAELERWQLGDIYEHKG